MPVIGTAGHVDHGKSTLVQALTGRDPDRWEEEKRRGLTIDLGFAWTTIDGREVSFVDVPGHERFVKNMLAGIEAVDGAVLVVAADEGWMPQTEEHAAVLDLLGLERVVVAITKADRVESTEPAHDDVRDRLLGLRFSNAPMVDVAAPTGLGIDVLTRHLADLVRDIPSAGPPVPHLWIDRAFSIQGAGTVVTGTLQGGPIDEGDRVTIQPTSAETRIRGIQTHERGAESVTPRQRVACNLGGVSVREVGRGSLLVKGDPWTETSRFLAAVRPARYAELDERGAFHVHMGSGAWPARLQLIDDQTAVLHLDRPAPTVFGAPFVLRESGRRLVTGGGRVLDPQPARRRAHIVRWVPALRRAVDRDEAASALLDARGRATPRELARDTAGGEARGAVGIGPELYSAAGAEALVAQGSALLDAFHRDYPLRAGMPVASLAEALDLTSTAIDDLASLAGWSKAGAAIALRGHDVALSPTDSAAWQRLRGLLGASWRVPRIKELGAEPELLAALLAQGRLVRVSDDLVFLPEQLEQIEAKLRAFSGSFTVSEFRQELDLSRKYAVPLLEWFDGQGVTRRQGDVRVVRPQATNDHRRPEA